MSRPVATAQSQPIRPMPQQHARLELDGQFSAETFALIQRGYIPATLLDKWFIYYDTDCLHFHRSATGTAVFQLEIKPEDDHYIAPIAIVNRDPQQYRNTDDAYDVELMAYLIDRYLLERNPPFPTPGKLHHRHRATHQQHVTGEQSNTGNGFITLNQLLTNTDDQHES